MNDKGYQQDTAPSSASASHQLRIAIKGPKVGEPRVSASDMAAIIEHTQSALKKVSQVLFCKQRKGKRRDPEEIDKACELFVVALERGSTVAVMELGEQPTQSILFGEVGQESLGAFIEGMRGISANGKPTSLPRGFDRGVMKSISDLGKVLSHGIESVSFFSSTGIAGIEAHYDAETHSTIRALLAEPQEIGHTSKTGRLEILDAHNKLAGSLWEPDGTRWICIFNEEHAESIAQNWRRTVTIAGKGKVEDGKRIIEVESILTTDDEFLSTQNQGELFAFWESVSLEDLARHQQVSPAPDLDELGDLWPAGDDPDKFLDFVLAERSKRRSASNGGGTE